MLHQCQIYVLFDEGGRVNYVGRTARPIEKRMYEHRRVLGFKPRYRVIDCCSTDCRDVEKRWIDYYRERGYTLRNISYGQGPHFLPESSRKKIALAFIGRPVTWGDKIRAAQKGIPKNWSAEGLTKVKKNQFKKGTCNWDSLSEEQKRSIRKVSSDNWKDPVKAGRMAKGLQVGSAHRSAEERKRIGKKIRESQLARPDEDRAATGRPGGRAMHAAHPGLTSRAIKKFWEDLRKDPERYREYIDRRAASIAAAKAKKKHG